MAAVVEKISTLSENEIKLFSAVEAGNVDQIKTLIYDEKVDVNSRDDHGMTPLQHAAYRGKREVCDFLLSHGADVNSHYHEHGYTALMFAAISGHEDIVLKVLGSGASTSLVNAVGRTAAQMAGFVGNHQCVAIINNYIPRETVDYYTVPHGVDPEPMLPSHLAGQFHKLIINTSIHPVRIIMILQNNQSLINESAKVAKVLRFLMEKEMKGSEINEVLAMKFHYLEYLVNTCEKKVLEKKESKDEKKSEVYEEFMKLLLKGRSGDHFPEYMEKFLRQCIREFPYPQSPILHQLVRSLAPVQIGKEPSALYLLDSTFNGQRMSPDLSQCSTCGVNNAVKKCSACKSVQYCDQRCQKLHWFTHKKECPELAEEFRRQEKNAGEKVELSGDVADATKTLDEAKLTSCTEE